MSMLQTCLPNCHHGFVYNVYTYKFKPQVGLVLNSLTSQDNTMVTDFMVRLQVLFGGVGFPGGKGKVLSDNYLITCTRDKTFLRFCISKASNKKEPCSYTTTTTTDPAADGIRRQ